MIQVKAISGDLDFVATELETLFAAGWEVVNFSVNLYDSSAGIRREATVFLKKAA